MLKVENLLVKIFLYLVSGVLLGVGFIFPPAWAFSFLGIALFLYAVALSQSLKAVVGGSFLVFLVKTMFATSVFWSINTIAGVDVDLGSWEELLVGLYWLSVSSFIGLGGVLCGLGLWFLKTKGKLSKGFFLVLFPVLFMVSEVFGSVMFSLLTYGEGGTINATYSLGYVGYLLAEHDGLLQLSRWGGVYLLSVTAVFVGTIFWFLFSNKNYRLLLTVFVSLVVTLWLTVSWGWSGTVETSKGIKVAVIDTEFGANLKKMSKQEEEDYKHQKVSKALTTALALSPDYVIMPEGSSYNNQNLKPTSAYRFFRFANSDPEAVVVDTGPAFLPTGVATIRANIYDGINKTSWAVDKQYLVPQGEYMPYIYIALLKALNLDDILNKIRSKLYYRPGPLAEHNNLPSEIPPILFCFEGLDPYGVKRLLKERDNVPFVAHPVSHTWFNESTVLWHELDTMLRIQALWNNTPIISAGNMTKGALYKENGVKVMPRVIKEGENWRVGLLEL